MNGLEELEGRERGADVRLLNLKGKDTHIYMFLIFLF